MRSIALATIVATAIACADALTVERRAVTLPPPNGKFDYQLGGAYTPRAGTTTVVRDRTASPAPGLYNICYINGFQTQAADEAWWKTNHDDLILRRSNGQYFGDPDWPGEFFLDTRTAAKRSAIAAILNPWITDCANRGFVAIEPDNLDTWTRSNGLLTRDNNLALAKLLADHAHSLGLAIAQKNAAELDGVGKATAGFDFAVVEECQVWNECNRYINTYGAAVLEVEYTDSPNAQQVFQAACAARGATHSVILRDRDLVPQGRSGHQYQEC